MGRVKLILTIFAYAMSSFGYAQVFKGRTDPKTKGSVSYCELKINPDSSVYLVFHSNFNESYSEYKGSIKKVNDTLFSIYAVSFFYT